MIELSEISKTFVTNKQTHHALKQVSLTIQPGEIFGIIGRSGAGKSTLLRCVNLLERPTSGSVKINQTDLTKLSRNKLNLQRHNISMIFQHFNLLESRNAFENVALPLELLGKNKADITTKVLELLKRVHLEGRENYYPNQLSGGQKQRVAIARALATDPNFLLCDEATSALDTESTQSILQLLKEINHDLGLTILLITHELDVIKRICDRAGVLEEGQLIEVGNIIDIFAKPQQQVTKQLVQKSLHQEIPAPIRKKITDQSGKGKALIIRLTFVGEESEEPIIATIMQKFNVIANILQANLETIHETTIGFTLCELIGKETDIQHALAYIQQSKVKAEVIGYV